MTESQIIQRIKDQFGLEPLPGEGGFYRETYRSNLKIPEDSLPHTYGEARSYSTAIYYLLTPDSYSAMHQLPGDEVYHFYLGDPVELLLLYPDRSGKKVILGNEIFEGMRLQQAVEGGVYQGAKLVAGGTYALLGTTMSPGFEFQDFTPGNRRELLEKFPDYKKEIIALT
ncbi:MAG: cupin domain-containing protein [Balneolaceae bacterium]|nr:cupin domain-containing protein [Balneolaceae bacterium]